MNSSEPEQSPSNPHREAVTQKTDRGESRSLVSNLRIVSIGTLLSRLLGLLRDIAMAALFGAGTTLDAFIVAFRIPNLTRQLFGEGALTTAFLPVFLRERAERGDQAARETLTAVAFVLAAFLSLLVLAGEGLIAASLFAFEFSSSTRLLLVLLAILLPYVVFICSAALMSAALHALRVFLWPALVPVVLNVIWLTGIFVAITGTSNEDVQIRIVASSITLAGVVQFLLPFVVLHRQRMGITRNWKRGWPRVREVVLTMLPVIVGLTVMQMNVVLDSLMAWGLAEPDSGGAAPFQAFGIPTLLNSGTATELYIGQRMYQFPLGVFGIALGTVLYPVLTQHAQAKQFDALRDDLSKGLRLTIAIALPASAGLFLLSLPLADLLFRHGEFNREDTARTAQMISTYGAGVWTYIGLTVLNRAFYATGDRLTPMKFGLIAFVTNIVLNVMLVFPLQGIGLALGSVLATLLQLGLTVWKMNQQIGPFNWSELLQTGIKTLLATCVMILCCSFCLMQYPASESLFQRVLSLMVPLVAGVISYIAAARMLQLRELVEILSRERRDNE